MGTVFIKTLIMFILSFVIAMVVALLIYWIRRLLTSVRVNSFFDEKSKNMVRRAQRIHKIHDQKLIIISEEVEHEVHPELFDFYKGINEEFEPSEDYHGELKPLVRRKRNTKKHKNI
jgi:hypothetical protein